MLRQLRDPEYFNPRSHEGSDGIFADLYAKKVISIHAPTRGATKRAAEYARGKPISIHAPTRGATDYNPVENYDRYISIHAPTRGATASATVIVHEYGISIHAPTRGATVPFDLECYVRRFQSTLPRGERQITRHFYNLL